MDGFPRNIKEDFGLISVEGGFFVNTNEDKTENIMLLLKGKIRLDKIDKNKINKYFFLIQDSKVVKFNGTKPMGLHFLPFELTPIQTAINVDSNSFYVLYDTRMFYFNINYKNHQIVLKSIETNVKKSIL